MKQHAKKIQGIDHYGVVAYVNDGTDKKNYVDGQFTGLQWQCVEYARRWLLQVRGITFDAVETAEDLWKLKTATSVQGTHRFKNSKKGIPTVGALLIYKKTNKVPFGHVAVIVDVHENGEIDVAEQNYSLKKWKGYSRRIHMTDPNIIGWKTVTQLIYG